MNRQSDWEDHLRLAVSYLRLGKELEFKPQLHAIVEAKFQQHFNEAQIIAKEQGDIPVLEPSAPFI